MSIGPIVCAWCEKLLVPGDILKPASHGICPDCKARVEREVA